MSQAAHGDEDQVVARSDIGTAFYLFDHQAGGHKPFLRSACGEVCKPAIALELQFYQALETRYPQLKNFVPPFVGVIAVDLHPVVVPVAATTNERGTLTSETLHDANAGIYLSTAANGLTQEISSTLEPVHSSTAISVDPATGAQRFNKRPFNLSGQLSSLRSHPTRSYISTTSYSAKLWRKERFESSVTSWVKETNQQLYHENVANLSREYLVLGDLTKDYSRPCVMDIKMGTRQHGEDATPAKAMSHSAKCASTTSLALGLRICGMQIYDEVEQRYVLWDKHWGRKLSENDIEPALATYLSNGEGLHQESLYALLGKLEELHGVISRTTGVRFWGSSLLLIYEGDLRNAIRREDVHLIDFAHCQMSDSLETPDDGLLLGLTNMISFLSNISDSHKKNEVGRST